MVTNNSGSTKGSKNGGGPNTGLIAGLTTGLVCAALIALTAGLLIYRKRKRAQMTDIKRKPASLESPPPPHTEIIMTAPTSSNIKVPSAPEPISAPTTLTPPAPALTPAPIATSTPDHYQEESLYIGSPLFIPPLSATTSTINKSNANGTNAASIQRSLTLSSRPQYDPSKTLARNNIGTIKNSNLSSPLNRSSSVKVTKYDYNPPILDDDDLDHVQVRRAISVKRRNAAAHSTYLAHQIPTTPHVSVSRSTSLRSQTAKSHLFDDGSNSVKTLPTTTTAASVNVDQLEDGSGNNRNNENNNEDDNGDDDDDDDEDDGDSLDETTSTSAKSGAIQVVCAKPTIARIRSISRKDSTGKKTTKIVEDHDQQPPTSSQHATTDDSSSSHLTPHQLNPLERMSMRSMPDSTHSSTLADGEITVYWQQPSDQ